MNDGVTPEATNIPTPGPAAGSGIEFSPQVPPIIPFPQPVSEPQVTAEQTPAPENLSLKDIHTRHAARYRELGQKQLDGALNDEEKIERESLNQMAGFGLFEADLSEAQLRVKDEAYKARIEAEAKELADPQASAERYRLLGKKLFDVGLTPEELEEYSQLEVYAKRGKFELPQAA